MVLAMREPLSPGQVRVLHALRDRVDEGLAPPTYRELCEQFGWRSTGTARDHLRALADKGYIRLSGGQARQVTLLDDRDPAAHVPILGRVVAGIPEAAEEERAGTLPVPRGWLRGGRHFALAVAGDSMSGAAILDGDFVVVRATPSARSGHVVVATVDGETTVKVLDVGSDGARLLAANPKYPPIPLAQGSVVVHGVVVGVLRHLGGLLRVEGRAWAAGGVGDA